MSSQPKTFLTPEEYLEIERKAEFKSEYFEGEMFAMAGARQAHGLIAGNLFAALHGQLRSRPCQVYANDMRVLVRPSGLYTYPDVVVVCGESKFLDGTRDTLLNPTVLIEVLSRSTELYDRTDKFGFYRSIDSLRHCMMVASEYRQIDLFTREADGRWFLTAASEAEEWVDLPAIECRLKVADVFEKVEWEEGSGGRHPHR